MDRTKRPTDNEVRLGGFEELVLLAVRSLHPDGYAVTLTTLLEREGERPVSLGAVYATLDRLERKGLVRSSLGPGSPERGGRRKRIYAVTTEGLRALQHSHAVRGRLQALAPRLAGG